MGGEWQGLDTICTGVDCDGACCLPDGSCVLTDTEAECTNMAGVWQGLHTICPLVRCPGACCLPSGECADDLTIAECTGMNGDFKGYNTNCNDPNIRCEGACCLPDGSCIDMVTPAECSAQGGVFEGLNTTCANILCAGPCCLPNGQCLNNLTIGQCNAQGGEWMGAGLLCSQVTCPTGGGGCADKGSLLIFSKVEIRWTNAGVVLQDTFLQLTNDYPANVAIKMYLINGDPPLAANPTTGERAHPGWNWVNNGFTLTGDQPIYWSALTGRGTSGIFDPVMSPFTVLDPGFPPGRPDPEVPGERMLRGFVVAWAVDSVTSREVRWNHLAGVSTLVHYRDAMAWEYRTCGFPVVANVAHGAFTGMSPGQLHLDGVEYRSAAAELLMNFQAVGSNAFSGTRLVTTDTDMTVHAVSTDVRQESNGPITTKVDISVWNQNEAKAGTHLCITCWDQRLLSGFPPVNLFTMASLQTNVGKARLNGVASQLCDRDTNGDGVLDIISQTAAIAGLVAYHFNIDGGAARETAGTNMFDLGAESAVITYDLQTGPPEMKIPTTREEVELFIEQLLSEVEGQ